MRNALERGVGFLRSRLADARMLAGRRTLVWFRWTPSVGATANQARDDVGIQCLSVDTFRQLAWSGNRYVFAEACEWRGKGQRLALAAFIDGTRLAGFCWLELQAADLRFFGISMPLEHGVGYLSRVWVDDQARGRGIGTALIAGLQSEAMRRGLSEVIGACVPANTRMRTVFFSSGFHEYTAVHRYYIPGLSVFRVRSPRNRSQFVLTGRGLAQQLSASAGEA